MLQNIYKPKMEYKPYENQETNHKDDYVRETYAPPTPQYSGPNFLKNIGLC